MSPVTRRPPAKVGRDQHRAWLQLVDTEGPFLAVPALLGVWPQGMPPLESASRQALVDAKPAFDRAWDAWDSRVRSSSGAGSRGDRQTSAVRGTGADGGPELAAYRSARDLWVKVVLRDVFGWREL